ncbi:unnamed protein product [Amoebophrya sp. A120]|nr:unnamed protein product [Amoebophrya sp. A120]|eukprot:GSA120T00003379001.1
MRSFGGGGDKNPGRGGDKKKLPGMFDLKAVMKEKKAKMNEGRPDKSTLKGKLAAAPPVFTKQENVGEVAAAEEQEKIEKRIEKENEKEGKEAEALTKLYTEYFPTKTGPVTKEMLEDAERIAQLRRQEEERQRMLAAQGGEQTEGFRSFEDDLDGKKSKNIKTTAAVVPALEDNKASAGAAGLAIKNDAKMNTPSTSIAAASGASKKDKPVQLSDTKLIPADGSSSTATKEKLLPDDDSENNASNKHAGAVVAVADSSTSTSTSDSAFDVNSFTAKFLLGKAGNVGGGGAALPNINVAADPIQTKVAESKSTAASASSRIAKNITNSNKLLHSYLQVEDGAEPTMQVGAVSLKLLSVGGAAKNDLLSPAEIKAKLRKLHQPVTLFGESDKDRLRRLQLLQRDIAAQGEERSSGQANFFQRVLRSVMDDDNDLTLKDDEDAAAKFATLDKKRKSLSGKATAGGGGTASVHDLLDAEDDAALNPKTELSDDTSSSDEADQKVDEKDAYVTSLELQKNPLKGLKAVLDGDVKPEEIEQERGKVDGKKREIGEWYSGGRILSGGAHIGNVIHREQEEGKLRERDKKILDLKRAIKGKQDVDAGLKQDEEDAANPAIRALHEEAMKTIRSADSNDPNKWNARPYLPVQSVEDEKKDAATGEYVDPSDVKQTWKNSKEYRVRKWIKKMWQIWAENLLARPQDEKESQEGKLQTAIFEQSRKDIQPLLKKLKEWAKQELFTSTAYRDKRKKETELGVEENESVDLLDKMVTLCDQKLYREATARYVELVIGNAANATVGRTRIYKRPRGATYQRVETFDAHKVDLKFRGMLNNEESRRYLQVFKRLMRVCETVHPPEEGSMTLS